MGSEEVSPLPKFTIREIFEQACPYYLSLGMTYEQFWQGDCSMVIAYRKAQQLKLREKNYHLWLQGLYVYEAIGALTPVMHAFAKRGTKPEKYLEKPYAVTADEIKAQELANAEAKRKMFKESLLHYAEQWERNKKGGEQP